LLAHVHAHEVGGAGHRLVCATLERAVARHERAHVGSLGQRGMDLRGDLRDPELGDVTLGLQRGDRDVGP